MFVGVAFAFIGWVVGQPASASASEPTYDLSWVRLDGGEQCPARPAIAARIEERLGRPVFDSAASRSIEAWVQHRGAGAGLMASIVVRDERGEIIGQKSLETTERDCQTLASAAVLAITFLVDGSSNTNAPPAPAPALVPTPAPTPAPMPVRPPHPDPPRDEPPDTSPDTDAGRLTETPGLALRAHAYRGLLPTLALGLDAEFRAHLA